MRFNKLSLAAMLLGGSVLLAACGGGDNAPLAPYATANTTANISAANLTSSQAAVQAVLGSNFAYTTGVPALGTTSATSLTLSGTSAAPSFALSSDSFTATGKMTYGSCIFTIVTSSYPAAFTHLQVGQTTTISPCNVAVDTAGLKADGLAKSTTVTLVLGATTSTPVTLTVSISSTGVVTVNDSPYGSVTVVMATGAGN